MTNENTPVLIKKSLFVNIVGRILITLAAFSFLAQLVNLQRYDDFQLSDIGKTFLAGWAVFLLKHLFVIFIFFMLKGIVQIIGGIGLLKRREWGRILTITIASINILITGGFIICYLYSLRSEFAGIISEYVAKLMLIGTVFCMIFIVFYLWVIIRLNCKNIRQEFKPVNNM